MLFVDAQACSCGGLLLGRVLFMALCVGCGISLSCVAERAMGEMEGSCCCDGDPGNLARFCQTAEREREEETVMDINITR